MKIGNMECDAILSHGMYSFIKESFMERSDNYYVFVCKFCGLLSESNTKMNYFKCSNKKCNHYTS
jgi:DNA-directed RNA polymerase beta subunit